MPDAAANSTPARSPLETRSGERGQGQNCAPPPPHSPHLHHGPAAIADSPAATTLPPTVTPATTTRQAVPLSTLWRFGSNPTVIPHGRPLVATASVPAIIAHAPSPEAQEPSSDLTTSTSSVPSTTTTLTNTLPPTQSAALRALNAPAFQSHTSTAKSKPAKSTSSRTTLSSQPVVVRTYSGPRHSSRPSSAQVSPRQFPAMNGHMSQVSSALSSGLAGRSQRLPSVEDFSFSAILRAVDPEIRDAIDAIAEICARSRLSLADEYDAHLPPQGEITVTGPGWAAGMGTLVGRGRISRIAQGWSAAENTLSAVPEASSSSEKLVDDSGRNMVSGGSKKRNRSAYGSLKSVISGGSDKQKATASDSVKRRVPQDNAPKSPGPSWAVNTASSAADRPSITLITSPQTSKQLSLDLTSTIKDIPESPNAQPERPLEHTDFKRTHQRNLSSNSMPASRTRSSTLSSLASWITWSRPSDLDSSTSEELTKAEVRLREMLIMSQSASLGKGKTAVSVA